MLEHPVEIEATDGNRARWARVTRRGEDREHGGPRTWSRRGLLPADQVRSHRGRAMPSSIPDATILSMPKSLIEQLGLDPSDPNGCDQRGYVERRGLRHGPPDDPGTGLPDRRRGTSRRLPRPDRPDPAGAAGFRRRPADQRLIGNPRHGGEQMIEIVLSRPTIDRPRTPDPHGAEHHEHPGRQEHAADLPGDHRQGGGVPLRAVPGLRHEPGRRRHARPRRDDDAGRPGLRHLRRGRRRRPAPTPR